MLLSFVLTIITGLRLLASTRRSDSTLPHTEDGRNDYVSSCINGLGIDIWFSVFDTTRRRHFNDIGHVVRNKGRY